eukprot:gene7767-9561_t
MCDYQHLIDRNDRLVLPETVKPINYIIHLHPNLREFTFSGEVDIKLQVIKPTKIVVIHAIELDIKLGWAGPSNKCTNIEYYIPEEVAILEFEHELTTDATTLHLEFTGILNDKLKGFYRSKYVVGGEDRYLATTQFESTDARRAFPCFDEPALKATFTIKLTVENHLTAISNMDIIKDKTVTNSDSTITYTFEETPVMSTYLLAFVVGELTFVESHTKEGIRVRVYNVIEKEESAQYALEIATKALSFFIDFFQIPYPLKKCDHIAIPDFSFGAMENWGLIAYRESILLTSSKTTLRTLQRIAIVIGHELAHQWFGNLVTMEWWSQLWLNEGFATFMGYLVTDHLFPEWNVWLNFSEIRNTALTLDSLENSHQIEVPVRSSSQIKEIFDAISYNKGSCIIQMVQGRFGDNFRKGLTHYLNKHSYKNTNTEDLWESLSILSGIDVKHFLDSFTKHSGYPVISFKSTSTPGQFELTQKKFKHGVESADDPTWVCYVKIQTDSGLHDVVLDKKSDIITIPNYNPNGWIKPNFGQTGYYRIDYDVSIIKGLIPQIKSLSLPAVDRHGLLVDTFYLARNKTIPITIFMDLVTAYVNETEYFIWSFIIDRLTYLSNLTEGESYHSKLNEITLKLLKPISKKLGFYPSKGESPSDVFLREKILDKLGALGDPETLAECRKLFQEFKKDDKSLPNDIRNTVLASVLLHGGEVEQNEIFEKYLKSTTVADKTSYLSVLSMTSSKSLVEKALEFSISKNVRSQDTHVVWLSVPNKFRLVSWEYLVKNFKTIDQQFHESRLFIRIISSTLKSRFAQSSLDEIEHFFKDHPVPIAERSIKQDLETININNQFFEFCTKELQSWVNNYSGN